MERRQEDSFIITVSTEDHLKNPNQVMGLYAYSHHKEVNAYSR